ncbi:hypothetical protein BSK59_16145 [Paenibacillus odorifer]|uniref:hypothetical protein n=1 Tax=Paenibacillus odorifer TaxID=189426 RepID=UPI00096C36B7|nr:hypothetical protein [Paenibacillus odorifer]OME54110.1 hypothetical protein BSK59_16145 [Paenibacillus odorifer]
MSRLSYDQIQVVVFVERDEKEVAKYFRLFRFMLGDQVTKSILSKDYAILETEKIRIRFYMGGLNMRGARAHYVINMMQNEEFNNICALPITSTHHYIKDDPKWRELFE